VNRAYAAFKFPVSVCVDAGGLPMIDTRPATVDVYTIETNEGAVGWDVTQIEKAGENFARACGLPADTMITINQNIGDGLAAMYVSKSKARVVNFVDVYKAVEDKPMNFCMGEDMGALVAIENLDRLPHFKILGMPGGGKTVLFRAIALSLAYSTSPMDVRLYIADPKGTDFISLKHLPHTKKVAVSPHEMDDMLADLLATCEKRAEMFVKGGVKSIDAWNAKYPSRKLPRLVLAVEEMTSVVGRAASVIVYREEEVEKGNGEIITRQVKDGTLDDKIVQKLIILAITYRYAGLRMILGTQRMDSDTFPGGLSAAIPGTIALAAPNRDAAQQMIKSNMPANLKFPGEACVRMPGSSKIERIIGAYIDDKTDDDEIIAQSINDYWRNRLTSKNQS
jgi:S-DNA-T family DNA segregation ATPase FtsK/SpoIIIE